MALQKLPGSTGFHLQTLPSASLNKVELGKFTDSNHLDRLLGLDEGQPYDRKIATLFSESNLNVKNDFFANIVNNADTFSVDNPNAPFYWDVDLPVELPIIMEIPASTLEITKIGEDGHTFQFISNRKVFVQNDIVAIHNVDYGPQVEITADPSPYNGYWLYTALLVTLDKTSYINSKYFKVGSPLIKIDNSIGEFDQNLSSIAAQGGSMRLFDRLGAGFGVEHTTTSWADQVVPKIKGVTQDITLVTCWEQNSKGQKMNIASYWSRTAEMTMIQEMKNMKTRRFLHGSAGTTQTQGQKQEIKLKSDGLMPKIRKGGNYMPIGRGDFSINLFRDTFDNFYRGRVDEPKETVLYANKAGMRAFKEASTNDLLAANLHLDSNQFIDGRGQNMVLNWGVSGVVTEETGLIRLIYLPELDRKESDMSYGTTKNTRPKFLSLDVLNNSQENLKKNIRIVRPTGQPGPTHGYIDGRRSHNGFAASVGMQSASKFPGSHIWMEDRCDLRIDDLSRTFLMEEEEDYIY